MSVVLTAPTDPAVLRDRARAFALAAALVTYPDEELAEILGDPAAAEVAAAAALRVALAGASGLDDTRSRYVQLFDRGGQRASLYETEYGRMRGMSKGNDLADIAGFYRAFGLEPEDTRREMLDHLAVELEFYTVLLLKQAELDRLGDATGHEIVEDARRKFLTAHLGGLAHAVSERGEVRGDPVYASVFEWCWELVARECAELGARPAPLDFFPDEDNQKDMSCGAVHLPVLQ